jgi:hypothetical protein
LLDSPDISGIVGTTLAYGGAGLPGEDTDDTTES